MREWLQKIQKFNFESEKGIAIYCAMAVLSIVLAIALGVGLLTAERIKMLNEAGNSVVAFSAAQTGIEQALFLGISSVYDPGCSLDVVLGEISYKTSCYDCDATSEFICIKSVGKYRNASRAVRVKL